MRRGSNMAFMEGSTRVSAARTGGEGGARADDGWRNRQRRRAGGRHCCNVQSWQSGPTLAFCYILDDHPQRTFLAGTAVRVVSRKERLIDVRIDCVATRYRSGPRVG